jgi:hypothetical protein
MMTTPTVNPDIDLRAILSAIIKHLLIWTPIIVGIIFQFLMFFFDVRRIYVILSPPGYIYPFVTLELSWWLLVTFITAILCLLIYLDRIRPHRLIYPFYLYLIYLLILVKPI